MIKRETFEEAHIKELQQMSRRDPQLIERSLYKLRKIANDKSTIRMPRQDTLITWQTL